jgi:pimeloyl-ACP methyl ester carboxylesterase
VVSLDNRGAGFSQLHPGRGKLRWTITDFAKDVLKVLDHLKWMTNVHIVGVSMGGMITQQLALLDPGRLASMTLIATYTSARSNRPNEMIMLKTILGLLHMARGNQRFGFLDLQFSATLVSYSGGLWIFL